MSFWRWFWNRLGGGNVYRCGCCGAPYYTGENGACGCRKDPRNPDACVKHGK